MLTLELPDFVNFVADVDFVHDFGAVETTRPSAAALARSIKKLMKPPFTVPQDCAAAYGIRPRIMRSFRRTEVGGIASASMSAGRSFQLVRVEKKWPLAFSPLLFVAAW
jgi:hypothetical protein